MKNELSKQKNWENYKKSIIVTGKKVLTDQDVLKILEENIQYYRAQLSLNEEQIIDDMGLELSPSNPEYYKSAEMLQMIVNKKIEYLIALKLKENPTVATHFGDDLDNRSCTYVLEHWAKENGIIDENESLNIERVPAGKLMEGIVLHGKESSN